MAPVDLSPLKLIFIQLQHAAVFVSLNYRIEYTKWAYVQTYTNVQRENIRRAANKNKGSPRTVIKDHKWMKIFPNNAFAPAVVQV